MDAYVFVVHAAGCRYKANKFAKNCRCRKWIYEYGSRKRYSAKTRSWETAEKLIADPQQAKPSGITVADAVKDFLSDKKEQNVGSEWYDKLAYELGLLSARFPETQLALVGIEDLKEFRKGWVGNPLTRSKKQERLRSFFLYCQRHGWVKENPAGLLSRIKVDRVPTDFFSKEEIEKILAAVDRYHAKGTPDQRAKARQRARAMILLLRHSGLRLGDAARLERRRLQPDGRLFLYMAKTGEPVYARLPPGVTAELRILPNRHPLYFFWSGNGDRKTVVDDWWRTLSRIFKHADLGKRAHPHMFRDTFAVHLLLSGAKLEQVQMLLGHSSIKITEAHYSPWCKDRQDMLDEVVRKAW